MIASRAERPRLAARDSRLVQTRRFFGGRHPLWGIGVTSRIETTRSPTDASAWIADSRPLPGPWTRTCTRRSPRFMASRPQFSAATVAYILINIIVVSGMRALEKKLQVPGFMSIGGGMGAGH